MDKILHIWDISYDNKERRENIIHSLIRDKNKKIESQVRSKTHHQRQLQNRDSVTTVTNSLTTSKHAEYSGIVDTFVDVIFVERVIRGLSSLMEISSECPIIYLRGLHIFFQSSNSRAFIDCFIHNNGYELLNKILVNFSPLTHSTHMVYALKIITYIARYNNKHKNEIISKHFIPLCFNLCSLVVNRKIYGHVCDLLCELLGADNNEYESYAYALPNTISVSIGNSSSQTENFKEDIVEEGEDDLKRRGTLNHESIPKSIVTGIISLLKCPHIEIKRASLMIILRCCKVHANKVCEMLLISTALATGAACSNTNKSDSSRCYETISSYLMHIILLGDTVSRHEAAEVFVSFYSLGNKTISEYISAQLNNLLYVSNIISAKNDYEESILSSDPYHILGCTHYKDRGNNDPHSVLTVGYADPAQSFLYIYWSIIVTDRNKSHALSSSLVSIRNSASHYALLLHIVIIALHHVETYSHEVNVIDACKILSLSNCKVSIKKIQMIKQSNGQNDVNDTDDHCDDNIEAEDESVNDYAGDSDDDGDGDEEVVYGDSRADMKTYVSPETEDKMFNRLLRSHYAKMYLQSIELIQLLIDADSVCNSDIMKVFVVLQLKGCVVVNDDITVVSSIDMLRTISTCTKEQLKSIETYITESQLRIGMSFNHMKASLNNCKLSETRNAIVTKGLVTMTTNNRKALSNSRKGVQTNQSKAIAASSTASSVLDYDAEKGYRVIMNAMNNKLKSDSPTNYLTDFELIDVINHMSKAVNSKLDIRLHHNSCDGNNVLISTSNSSRYNRGHNVIPSSPDRASILTSPRATKMARREAHRGKIDPKDNDPRRNNFTISESNNNDNGQIPWHKNEMGGEGLLVGVEFLDVYLRALKQLNTVRLTDFTKDDTDDGDAVPDMNDSAGFSEAMAVTDAAISTIKCTKNLIVYDSIRPPVDVKPSKVVGTNYCSSNYRRKKNAIGVTQAVNEDVLNSLVNIVNTEF